MILSIGSSCPMHVLHDVGDYVTNQILLVGQHSLHVAFTNASTFSIVGSWTHHRYLVVVKSMWLIGSAIYTCVWLRGSFSSLRHHSARVQALLRIVETANLPLITSFQQHGVESKITSSMWWIPKGSFTEHFTLLIVTFIIIHTTCTFKSTYHITLGLHPITSTKQLRTMPSVTHSSKQCKNIATEFYYEPYLHSHPYLISLLKPLATSGIAFTIHTVGTKSESHTIIQSYLAHCIRAVFSLLCDLSTISLDILQRSRGSVRVDRSPFILGSSQNVLLYSKFLSISLSSRTLLFARRTIIYNSYKQ